MMYVFVGAWAVALVYASFRFLGDKAGYGSLVTAAVVAFLIYKDYKDKKAKKEEEQRKSGKKIITAGKAKNAPKDISSVAHMSTKGKKTPEN